MVFTSLHAREDVIKTHAQRIATFVVGFAAISTGVIPVLFD